MPDGSGDGFGVAGREYRPRRHKGWEMVKKKQPELLNSGVWSDGFLFPVNGASFGKCRVVEKCALGLVDVDVGQAVATVERMLFDFRDTIRTRDAGKARTTLNAQSPITVTPFGIVMLVSSVQR